MCCVALAALSSACTRWGFGVGHAGDGGPSLDDAAGSDYHALDGSLLPDLAESCLPWVEPFDFEAPRPVDEANSPYREEEPFLTADGLTLYFCSDRPGGSGQSDIYYVTRPDPQSPFGPPQNYAAINTADEEWRLVLSLDALTAYLTCDWPGGSGDADIWTATRPDVNTPFARADFSPVAELNTPQDEHDPFPSADGRRLYYYTRDWFDSQSAADLLVAERPGPTGPFGVPVPVPGVNDFPRSEGNPVTSPDELLLVFSSNRSGGRGSSDLWYATRADRQAPFVVRSPLPSVNTEVSENNLHLTPDGCTLYFSREYDIFVSRQQGEPP